MKRTVYVTKNEEKIGTFEVEISHRYTDEDIELTVIEKGNEWLKENDLSDDETIRYYID